jgi:hypothetical protein
MSAPLTPEVILALGCLVGSPARPLLPHEAVEVARIAQAESGGDTLAINVNGPNSGRVRVGSLDEAISTVTRLRAQGRSVDVGRMQVNLTAHPNAFPTLAAAFGLRTNVCAGARIYVAGVERAARCAYNTGRLACSNGHPEAVQRASVRLVSAEEASLIARQRQAYRDARGLAAQVDPPCAPSWDGWALAACEAEPDATRPEPEAQGAAPELVLQNIAPPPKPSR